MEQEQPGRPGQARPRRLPRAFAGSPSQSRFAKKRRAAADPSRSKAWITVTCAPWACGSVSGGRN